MSPDNEALEALHARLKRDLETPIAVPPMTTTPPPARTARTAREIAERLVLAWTTTGDPSKAEKGIYTADAAALTINITEALLAAASSPTAAEERARIVAAILHEAEPGSMNTVHGRYTLRVLAGHIRDGQHWHIVNLDRPQPATEYEKYLAGEETAKAATELHHAEAEIDRVRGERDELQDGIERLEDRFGAGTLAFIRKLEAERDVLKASLARARADLATTQALLDDGYGINVSLAAHNARADAIEDAAKVGGDGLWAAYCKLLGLAAFGLALLVWGAVAYLIWQIQRNG